MVLIPMAAQRVMICAYHKHILSRREDFSVLSELWIGSSLMEGLDVALGTAPDETRLHRACTASSGSQVPLQTWPII